MAIPTSYLYPYGSPAIGAGAFPDNDLKPMEYDSRVTSNDMLRIGRGLMHASEAYYREEDLLGNGIYTWNEEFVKKIQQSLAENKIANFSKVQRRLFNEYIVVITDGITGNESEAVLALDTYLGGL